MRLSLLFVPLHILFFLVPPVPAADSAARYNYISSADLEVRLKAAEPVNIIDIQIEEDFARHHIRGAEATHAYPVRSDADRAKLEATVERLRANNDPVVIVCPRGAGGARRTYDFLLTRGVPFERLLILEKGQEGWDCPLLTEPR